MLVFSTLMTEPSPVAKYCIRAIGIGCNIAAFDVDLTTVDTENYCVLTTEITIVIACRIACFIEYAVSMVTTALSLPMNAFDLMLY